MKPFAPRNLSRKERILNHRLSRARSLVKNAFGILASNYATESDRCKSSNPGSGHSA